MQMTFFGYSMKHFHKRSYTIMLIMFCMFCSFFLFANEQKENTAAADVQQKTEEKTADKTEVKTEDDDATVFSSIEENGYTVGYDDTWMFNSFDSKGRQAFQIVFKNALQIHKVEFEYWDDTAVLKKTTQTNKAEIVVKLYNEQGLLMSETTTDTQNNELKKRVFVYDVKNRRLSETIIENTETKKTTWAYNSSGAVISEYQYVNGEKTAAIIYNKNGTKMVTLFENGKEIIARITDNEGKIE